MFLFFSCSNEPVEFTINQAEENEENEPSDHDEIDEDAIYATAKLDGQNFFGNELQIDTLSTSKLKLSFFSDLEQQIFLILPNPIAEGTYDIIQNDEQMSIYSGAFINSVGNVSESIFYSIPESGEIVISSYDEQTGDFSGSFEFDVATSNNNIILITEGIFTSDP
jgi:hypothetical protein